MTGTERREESAHGGSGYVQGHLCEWHQADFGHSEWRILADNDEPDAPGIGKPDNVFEVHSTSTALSLDGKTHYNEW